MNHSGFWNYMWYHSRLWSSSTLGGCYVGYSRLPRPAPPADRPPSPWRVSMNYAATHYRWNQALVSTFG